MTKLPQVSHERIVRAIAHAGFEVHRHILPQTWSSRMARSSASAVFPHSSQDGIPLSLQRLNASYHFLDELSGCFDPRFRLFAGISANP